jgi:hypothetical protein
VKPADNPPYVVLGQLVQGCLAGVLGDFLEIRHVLLLGRGADPVQHAVPVVLLKQFGVGVGDVIRIVDRRQRPFDGRVEIED